MPKKKSDSLTVSGALRWGTAALKKHRCKTSVPEREASALMAFVMQTDETHLLLIDNSPIGRTQEKAFRTLIARRLRHAPLAYLLGTADFLGRTFSVSPKTLIPRPATESLVAAANARVGESSGARIVIDVGTGSGCIAVSLAASLGTVWACDTSVKALAVARKNAKTHGVSQNITFKKGSLLAPFATALRAHSGDVFIVANLPYVPTAMRKSMSPDITKFEPASALFSGKDGLAAYKKLLREVSRLMTPRQRWELFIEALPQQFDALASLAKKILGATADPIPGIDGAPIGLTLTVPLVPGTNLGVTRR